MRAFHAADEPAMNTAALANVAATDMHRIIFRLPVSACLITSEYPIHRIWQVNQADWKGDRTVDLEPGNIQGHKQIVQQPYVPVVGVDALLTDQEPLGRDFNGHLSAGSADHADLDRAIVHRVQRHIRLDRGLRPGRPTVG